MYFMPNREAEQSKSSSKPVHLLFSITLFCGTAVSNLRKRQTRNSLWLQSRVVLYSSKMRGETHFFSKSFSPRYLKTIASSKSQGKNTWNSLFGLQKGGDCFKGCVQAEMCCSCLPLGQRLLNRNYHTNVHVKATLSAHCRSRALDADHSHSGVATLTILELQNLTSENLTAQAVFPVRIRALGVTAVQGKGIISRAPELAKDKSKFYFCTREKKLVLRETGKWEKRQL